MKPIVMQEAVQFLLEKAATITTILTKEHHKMIRYFVEVEYRNEIIIKERELFLKNWSFAE